MNFIDFLIDYTLWFLLVFCYCLRSIFTCKSSYCFQCILAIAILYVHPSGQDGAS